MADPTIPRYEDYYDERGRPKPAPARPKPTLRQRAQRLARDIPVAADALNAFPAGAAVAAPIKLGARGLARAAAPAARLVDGPAARPVLRGAYDVPADIGAYERTRALRRYAVGMAGTQAAGRLASNSAGRRITFEEDDKKKGLSR